MNVLLSLMLCGVLCSVLHVVTDCERKFPHGTIKAIYLLMLNNMHRFRSNTHHKVDNIRFRGCVA